MRRPPNLAQLDEAVERWIAGERQERRQPLAGVAEPALDERPEVERGA